VQHKTDVVDNLNEVDRFTQMERFHAAVDLDVLELRGFVNKSRDAATSLLPAPVEVEEARHHPKHLSARQKTT
jgi:hypothetical protein